MADRYFVTTPIQGASATLAGNEAHHLAHVMRAKPGHEVTLFDGSGQEFAARVEKVGRSEIELSVLSQVAVDRELPAALTLGVALPKGDRQRWLVEKAVELGVTRIVPLQTARANDRESTSALDKLRKSVVEASKQCGRNRLMEISAAQPLAAFLDELQSAEVKLVAEPGAPESQSVLDRCMPAGESGKSVALLVGPEGGLTPEEVEQAKAAGWQAVGLGSRILRIETAVLSLAFAVTMRMPPRGE